MLRKNKIYCIICCILSCIILGTVIALQFLYQEEPPVSQTSESSASVVSVEGEESSGMLSLSLFLGEEN